MMCKQLKGLQLKVFSLRQNNEKSGQGFTIANVGAYRANEINFLTARQSPTDKILQTIWKSAIKKPASRTATKVEGRIAGQIGLGKGVQIK
jgi:hypothetical protein